MILHLDSTFRNIKTFPFPSEYEIEFNGQPPPNAEVRDVRGQYVTAQYAQYSFRWIGNQTSPLYGIPNDSFTLHVIPLSPYSCLLGIADAQVIYLLNDYFVGIVMQNTQNGLSSVIAMYTASDFVFTLDQPIFQAPFSTISYSELARTRAASTNVVTVTLTNPTFTAGNNLVILGSTSLVASSPTEFALAKGINTSLFVENVTQKWSSKIQSIVGTFRNVILDSFPSYASGDVFIVWLQNTSFQSETVALRVSGIQDFLIQETTGVYSPGDRLFNSDGTIEFEVLRVDPQGNLLELQCLEAGSFQTPGHSVWIKRLNQEAYFVKVGILQTGNWFRAFSSSSSEVPLLLRNVEDRKNPLFLIGILNPLNFQMLYFSVIAYYYPLLYLNITAEEVKTINQLYTNSTLPFRFFVIPFFSLFPNINAPIVPYQNATCCQVSIVSISLPNLPVCGFDILLSDLPYVLVSLINVNTPNNDSYGTLVSNNPASFSANFVCPIANIRNPNIVKFVVVGSNQKTVFKFTPRNSLRFRVTLPNGELLKYSTTFIPYDIPCKSSPLSLPVSPCSSINQPLNFNTLDDNALVVFPLTSTNLISATFLFTPL